MSIFKSNAYSITNDILVKIFKFFLVLYCMAMTIITLDGFINTDAGNNKIARYAIVYGSKIEENGLPSERLKARLDAALLLLQEKKVERIIVSGGLGETGFEEAEVMRRYLLEQGVKIPWVIVDSEGYTTMDTSMNAYKINQARGHYPNVGVIGVSHFFHISRVKLSLKKAGFKYVGSASPDYFELRDIYSLIREVPAYIKYLFLGVSEEINVDSGDLKIISEKVVEKIKEIK
ncbi:YdcF family protein [Candidatus Gracilibacteria bacterium]|nr:YdcF family protein [Candidatus Gracilibacteria bacterium]